MIFDSYEAFRAVNFTAKVCILGSGPAGTTIARKLGAAGIPVVVLEAGSREFSDDSQDFYRGVTVGDPYFDLDITRLRFMGGSSNHWAGWCRVLDSQDFEAKAWAPDTGWPLGCADIEPYLPEVQDILELPDFRPDVPISDDIRWVQLIKSPAVRFGEKFADELDRSRNVAVVLSTYATELTGDGKRVIAAKLWSNGQDAGFFTADYFIVCTGGLENSRLLLWSNQRSNGGVVPKATALGRYWMEHPTFEGGNAILADYSAFEVDATNEAFFSPTPAAMERLEIMNFGIRLIQTPYPGIKSLIADLACTAPEMAEWVSYQLSQNLRCAAQLYVAWEQAPLASNQIRLSKTDVDPAGVPRIELHWKKSELERRTLLEGLRLFGTTLVRKDLGRVRIADWLANGGDYPTNEELAGHHHMGGTRMGTDVTKSVVDANSKVHGMDNLYVGGSSVFCTSGECNPTTTIVALACRLGDHLSKVIGA
ncbi:MAG: GMC family oxidoreductase [Mesorhizobium sp.]|uniref:GMC oxidoreductase n=1 Tax=Mesorhizobium sp. TaxID=1871066 RepID=UPI000FEA0408|nr:GMC family oxidoreductase [Mesorhizobium sp.]RWM17014.1 MAG: GMC family oxidoreductase [Mesorhizobium sp.]TIP74111.1 MAG: GMC family oxidoreductase [Mesorhizobium sp.]TIQ06534.1 MAG: GMC family oxidoreductase [Mesorhizobium sp.]TIR50267.1 MAG: GMC family oxidoreductase [Mesorhizobium sp.]TJV96195.1 MAG: GMC family oxidoreductase [Mesorhizobium sp.]